MNAPRRIPIFWLLIIGVISVVTILVLAGRMPWYSTQTPLELLPNMDNQFKVIPQSGNTFFADRASVRVPVEGTVARGQQPYALQQGDIDTAELVNVNNTVPNTPFVLARGQNRFNVFCSPCHNYDAKGMSKVAVRGLWLGIPNLTRPETQALSNARLFHVISAGQNLMPSYADKVSPTDRWAIIYYLRSLQGVEGVASNVNR
ncbi:MAG: cytochrome c [bacterium]|nr:cytochrome c [bacterium]